MAWKLITMEKEPFGKFELEKIQCMKDINETLKLILTTITKNLYKDINQ